VRVQGFTSISRKVYLADDNIIRIVPLFLEDPMLDNPFEIADGRSVEQEQVRPSLPLDKFVHGRGIEVCLRKCL
jgi:hypothetical protein